jgi:Protein of unknown function (DUF3800)
LVLQVFVDDSGAKGQESPAVFAGLLQTAEEWMAFSDDWSGALSRSPSVPRFKMSEAVGRSGPFRFMSEEQRDAKLRELAAVVTLHHPTVFRTSIDLESFAEHSRLMGLADPLDVPFFHLALTTIWRVVDQLRQCNHRERFEIVFDRHLIYEDRIRRWYPVFCKIVDGIADASDSPPRWTASRSLLPHEPTFRTDDEFMPLQCADLYAWLLRAEMRGKDSRFAYLRRLLPPVAVTADMNSDYWRTMASGPKPGVALIDPNHYAELLGLRAPIDSLPRNLRGRAVAYAASLARRSPSAPLAPGQAPPVEPLTDDHGVGR